MSNNLTLARAPYTKRPIPSGYDAGWLSTEFQNIQRAVPPSKSRTALTDDTPTVQDSLVLYDATNGPITVTLRPPNQVQDLRLILKKIDSSGNAVTIHGTVDGTVNPVLSAQYSSLTIQSDGSSWYILAQV